MNSYQIHISGIVQGVGFRPFIYNLAKEYGLKGWVSNTSSGVYIQVNCTEEKLASFTHFIKEKAPERSYITDLEIKKIEAPRFNDFRINRSFKGDEDIRCITPDYAICEDCSSELKDKEDRRFEYAFITCTHCGPRYSIMDKLPYDRELTSMKAFIMCPACQAEYDNPNDRRFFSQSNSCPDCGIHLKLYSYEKGDVTENSEECIDACCLAIDQGKILAIKGIGGYMLMADAQNVSTIQLLRKRKRRPDKAFALMVKDLEMMNAYAEVSEYEEKAFLSDVAPILLVKSKKNTSLPLDLIAPGLNELGLMRPYTPLHLLVLERLDRPLIATSANLSSSPIIYKDEDILEAMKGIADLVLMNNRKIMAAQDDSVIRFTEDGQAIIIRRSRGMAPNLFHKEEKNYKSVLALGAMLKSTFSLFFKGNSFLSQYIGDSNSYETQVSYLNSLSQLESILDFKAEVLLSDKHPGYFSSELAEELAFKANIPNIRIQHHEAHFAAILGEHKLWNEKILGIIWDGTGLGNDQHIWGGECFLYKEKRIDRLHHLPYQRHILGDKMVEEPRISALSFFKNIDGARDILKTKFNDLEWELYQRQLTESQLYTSSIGRLFDAVASILSIKDKSTFHGQAAMLLEAKAVQHEHIASLKAYKIVNENNEFDLSPFLSEMVDDINKDKPDSEIAARFHLSLLEYIQWMAAGYACKQLCFSGGVFQNKLLVELIKQKMSDHTLYFHQSLSPNDESISFGQLMHYFHIAP